MNILFLTMTKMESLTDGPGSIYGNLLKEFQEKGHNIFVMTPREKRDQVNTDISYLEDSTFLKVKTGNFNNVHLVEKGISTLQIESNFLNAYNKFYSHIKFDLILYSTPPITFTKLIDYVKKRDGATSYLLLKDIFPQNAVDLKMFSSNSLIYRVFRKKERKLYQLSDHIGCMSPANVEYILSNNSFVSKEKIEVNPNSVKPEKNNISKNEISMIRKKYGIPFDKTVFIYGGNLGKPQGIDFLIECIKKNETNKSSFFVIVGSGSEFKKMNRFFNEMKPKNSILLKRIPKNEYNILANSCDVGLIFLDKRFTIPNFPSRLLSYMQAKMPVLSATDPNTDIGDVIEQGRFGYSCISNDVNKFNDLVNKLATETNLERMGQNAWNYLIENYTTEKSYEIIMSHFKDNL